MSDLPAEHDYACDTCGRRANLTEYGYSLGSPIAWVWNGDKIECVFCSPKYKGSHARKH